jgi:DNA-binding LytR/AlgR family response regulator
VPPVQTRQPEAAPPGQRAAWRAALPSELGDDVVAVASELQYLRVWTVRGAALVLGSLQEVEDAEGAAGMRVHRSWWVNAMHVRAVRRRGDGAVCELSDGREIPVSRRRKADVLARFGDSARYDVVPGEPAQNIRRNPN